MTLGTCPLCISCSRGTPPSSVKPTNPETITHDAPLCLSVCVCVCVCVCSLTSNVAVHITSAMHPPATRILEQVMKLYQQGVE